MICQNCNINQATVKYTQIINGLKTEMNLCEICSKELGLNTYNFNMPINFSNFLSDFIDDYNIESMIKVSNCKKCNMSYDEFLKLGKLGCSECYNHFSNKMDNVLKKIQGANRYTGNKILNLKQDKSVSSDFEKKENPNKEKIEKLKKELKVKIEKEEYEEAAKIRDEIRKIEKGE